MSDFSFVIGGFTIDAWVVFGFFAQFLFFSRFVVQWLYSEYYQRTVIPMYFWYLSVAGSLAIIVYAYHARDIVILSGQVIVFFIYVRNIQIAQRTSRVEQ